MKTKLMVFACAILFGMTQLSGAATNDLSTTLQKGLFEEEANHNLPAAIQAYQSIVSELDEARQLAATAIFRLGECYRKQGKTNEALAQYERIVRDFSDQPTLVTLSRQNLAGLGSAPTTPAAQQLSNAAATAEAQRLELDAQIAELRKLPEEKLRVAVQQSFPNPVLTSLMQKLTDSEQNLTRLSRDLGEKHPETVPAKATIETIRKQIMEQVQATLAGLELKRDTAAKTAKALQAQMATAPAAPSLSDAARQEQKQLLQQEIKLVEKKLAEEQKKVDTGIISANELLGTQRELLGLKRQLAALDVGPTGGETAEAQAAASNSSEAGEIKRIQIMIKDSPDLINAGGSDSGGTLLHQAAFKGELAVAKFLLENGANIEARNSRYMDYTPLLQAVAAGHKSMVELLLNQKANIQAADSAGNTPLHVAAREGYKNVVEVLLAHGANVNAKRKDGVTPLQVAAANGWDAIAELLVRHAADVNATASQIQDRNNRSYHGAPLHIAAALGDLPLAELLLKSNANVNARNKSGETPLHDAAEGGHVGILQLLLADKADINAKDEDGATPLVNAMLQKQWDTAKFLVTNKAELNFGCKVHLNGRNRIGVYPIHIAMEMGNNDSLEFLLKNGADPDARVDGNGTTALGLATEDKGHKDQVELLLKYKANPNLRLPYNQPPLVKAVRNQEPEVVKLLLDHGADPNQKDQDGNAVLLLAVWGDQSEIAKALLAHKADPNVRSPSDGSTALHSPVRAGRKDLVELLLDNGADPNLTNNEGKTPLALIAPSGPASRLPVPPPPVPGALPPTVNAIPARTLRLPGGANVAQEQRPTPGEIREVLLQHGAMEELPDLSAIRMARKGSPMPPMIVFTKDTNSINRFTLMETIENFYRTFGSSGPLPFPDFSGITILRPVHAESKKPKEIAVNLLDAGGNLDCAKNVQLEFGDVVCIPEREHNLAEPTVGLTVEQEQELKKCLERKVTFVVKGQPTEVTLGGLREMAYLSFTLNSESVKRILRSSSDLSRLELKRKLPTGKPLKVSVQPKWGADDLWLLDGDVIEVPDKP